MKTKVFKSAVSVLLVLMLCFSFITPAVSAAEAPTATVELDDPPSEYATAVVNMTGEGSVKLLSDGAELTDYIPVGASFTVEAQPNEDRGYKPGTVVVKKNGNVLEGEEFGPAENGDEFEISAIFVFDPAVVNYEVNAESPKLKKGDFNTMFNESGNHSYGYSSIDNPTSISAINLNNGTTFSAGEYYIYSAPYNKNNPDWSVAKVKKMTLRTFYNGTFAVSGNENGKIYLNGTPLEGTSSKLYTDAEYTVTAENVEEYFYNMTGAEDGAAFTPTSAVNVKVAYHKIAHAVFTLNVNGLGTATVKSEGEATDEIINEGSTFTVEAKANTDRGYKLDNVVVTKNGEEVEAVEGAYGPVADGESYAITVNFKFEPKEVSYDLQVGKKLTSTIICGLFGDSVLSLLTKSYGFASVETPDQITTASTGGHTVEPGEYFIYKGSSSNWGAANVLKLKLSTYYNGSFTVTGHTDGEVYLNGQSVSGNVKLYTGNEYTVTVKPVDEYIYELEGATEGETFTPSADMNVTLTYMKPAFATFTVNTGKGGTATVRSGEFAVTNQVNAGSTFSVEPHPDTDKGYKLDSVVVTKDGEVVEAVDGEYGPVADGESYVINVSFKFEPREVNYNLHADKKLTSTIINDLFGDSILSLLTTSYGFASVETPDQITTASTSGHTVEPGEYYIYRGSSSNWAAANVLKLNLRTYYDGSFTVNGHEEGEIYLNGNAVSGSSRLYTDTEYTVTTKQIENYICTLYGAEEGVTFTPTADVEANAVYVKESYATFTVNATNGGTVKVMSNGSEMVDKINDGSTFTVETKANSDNGYYVKSVTVTKDGEEVEAVDGEYGPVAEGESYEVNVTFGKVTFALQDGEVSLTDIYYENFEAVEQEILESAALDPEEFKGEARFEIEYVAYTLLGFSIYEPLTYDSDTGHRFGTSEHGGTLKGGNTEKVRVIVTLPNYDIELSATAVMTVSDDRVATTLASDAESFTITYGDDLKAAVFPTLSVQLAENGEPIEFTEDDIILNPSSLNANLRSAQTAQEVTVTYTGSDIYASADTVVSVYVNRAQSSLECESETITYGETPAAKVVTTPENLDHLKVIAGVDANAKSFVSIIVPENVKERLKIKIAGIVILDIYQMLVNYIGEDGADLESLKTLIGELSETINSSDTIRQAIESSGFNMDTIERVMNFIAEMPDLGLDVRVRLEQLPKNAGTYTMFAISTDTNYTTSEDISYIVIRQKTNTDEEPVELRFREEMPQTLTYDEAQSFNFGGDLYDNGNLTEIPNLRTLYVGTTLRGRIVSQSEPATEPGVYTETVYLLGGNYLVTPIVREYTVSRIDTKLVVDNLNVTYDGEAHAVEVSAEDGQELTGNLTVIYSGIGHLGSKPPVDAGVYTVAVTYAGDEYHKSASTTAKLTIEKRDAVITVNCKETVPYGEISKGKLAAAELGYTLSHVVDGDSLGFISPTLNTGDNFPNVGEYTVTARFIQSNNNYNVTIEDATLTIVPKEVVVAVDSVEKIIGADDPKFTYTVTDTEGKTLNLSLNLTLAREQGEEIGEYRIYIDGFNETNYVLSEASTEGVLKIKDTPYILGDANGDGVVSVKDVTAIQRYLAQSADIDLRAADVDGSGTVDINDATELQKYLAEFEVSYPIGQTI